MKHTKQEWMPLYSFLDRKRVTDHLADMAARGWMLDRLGTWSWHYRRTEPKQLRFAVTFFAGAGRFSPAPAAGLDTFQDYCAKPGGTGRPAPTRYKCFTARIRRPFPSTPTRRRSWRTSDGALESP